jgi:two-component system cell cycle sensor histidine kinase/response regulator CckA
VTSAWTTDSIEVLRVLIVEDNDDDALLVREMLRDEGGFVSVRAGTIRGAAAELAAGSFECILLDLSLPDSEGITTVAELRTLAAGVPIIVLTGLDDELRGLEAIRAGAEDYLVKGRVTGNVLARIMRFAVARHVPPADKQLSSREEEQLVAREFELDVPKRLIVAVGAVVLTSALISQLAIGGQFEFDMVYAFGVAVVALGLGTRWGILAAAFATVATVGLEANESWSAALTQGLGYLALGMLGGRVADGLRNLRDSRARHLEDVVGQTDAAIMSVTLPGTTVTSWNRGCQEMLGWESADVIGTPATFLRTPESDFQSRRAVPKLMAGETISHDTRWTRRDGEQIDVAVSAAPLFSKEGVVHGASIVATDISSQAATVRALRRAEERFRGAFANAPAGMAVVSLDPATPGRLLQVNPAFAELTGYSKGELLTRNLRDVLKPPEGIDPLAQLASDPHAPRRTEEGQIERADGEVIWVEVSTSTNADEDGVALHSIAQVQDITARKSVDRVRARLASIVSGSSDAILAGDASGVISSWNDGAERLYGYTAGEAIGSPAAMLVPPHRRAEYQGLRKTLLAGGSIIAFETQRRTRDGRILDVSMSVSPITDDRGEIIGASSIERDITLRNIAAESLRESEERLRQVVETASEGIVVTDTEGITTFANAKAAEIFGTTPESMLGTEFSPFLGVSGATDGERQEEFRRPDGSDGWAHVANSSMRNANGDVTGALSMVTDITDRLLAERETKAMEAMLHQAQRLESLGQLAGGVAHDMNNLLAVIMNFADFATDAVDGGPGTDELREIRQASESAAGLIRQLLLFARQEVTHPETLRVTPLLEGLENLLRRAVGEQVEFAADYQSDLPAIRADAGMIEQVVMNLVVNARDAMPDGGTLTVTTSTRALTAADGLDVVPGNYVCLSVVDSGEGMTDDVAAKAFDPFFSTKPRGSGTGLGLATVYGIAARFGGRVELQSELGRGTRVAIFFPVAEQTESAETSRSETPPDTTARGGTILLVEDDDGVRRVAARILEEQGYDVITASRPSEALALAGDCAVPLDLLFTDVVMPEMSGPKLALALQERQPDLRVVFSSGYTDRPEELPPGARFVAKPFTRSALLAEVAAATAEPVVS